MLNTEISPDVAALVDTLKGVSPGSMVSYADLSAVVGRDLRKTHRWLLLRAITVAARDHGAVFANERGVGYARLTTEQLSDVGATARGRIRRTARLGAKRMRFGLSRANDVPPEAQRKINAELSALSLIEHISGDKASAPTPAHDVRAEPVAIAAKRMLEGLTQ